MNLNKNKIYNTPSAERKDIWIIFELVLPNWSIITTNKNNTEIAPIYNNNIIKDKNSISNNNKKQDPVTIKKTKLNIEYKALREKITITAKK